MNYTKYLLYITERDGYGERHFLDSEFWNLEAVKKHKEDLVNRYKEYMEYRVVENTGENITILSKIGKQVKIEIRNCTVNDEGAPWYVGDKG